ncbi:MAG: hypothetical protein ACREIF_16325 [Chthoniobacterales bacterium]
MTTILPPPLFPETPSAASHLVATLLEPLFLVATCLFWAVVLPMTGLFCTGVATYDYIAALTAKEFRLPHLRTAASNPLVIRKVCRPIEPTAPASAASHAAQA